MQNAFNNLHTQSFWNNTFSPEWKGLELKPYPDNLTYTIESTCIEDKTWFTK